MEKQRWSDLTYHERNQLIHQQVLHHEGPLIGHYTSDLNAAWEVMRFMAERMLTTEADWRLRPKPEGAPPAYDFTADTFFTALFAPHTAHGEELYPAERILPWIADLTADGICQAAAVACRLVDPEGKQR